MDGKPIKALIDKVCPKCKIELHLVSKLEPWHDEYLICPKCDGTYNIDEIRNQKKFVHCYRYLMSYECESEEKAFELLKKLSTEGVSAVLGERKMPDF